MYDNSHCIHFYHYNDNARHFNTRSCNYTSNYGQPWSTNPSYGANINQTYPETSIIVASNERRRNTEFFDNFINECTNTSNINERIKSNRLGISKIRALLASIRMHNVNLKELTYLMVKKKNELSDCEWQDKVRKCTEIKNEILKLLTVVKVTKKINNFNDLIVKRRKKRQRIKELREERKTMKMNNAERRLRLHTAADTWIQVKQAVIEREKEEENLRKDADIILSEIRAKRSDARKCLALLNELQNLRKAKVNNARARGEKLSVTADQTFENIIVQLTEQWFYLNHEYSIEEQGLKVMVKTDNEKLIKKRKKSTFDEWEIAIFGGKLSSIDSIRKNLNNLIMTRFAWDKYICYNDKNSRIPIGWIMPETSSSAAWQKLLKK